MQKIIMHLDMNSYFASVEQQANPLLRGRPVGVCAYLSPRGCIIACSIEAKTRGVHTGMRVNEAKILCPDIVLLQNDPEKYRYVSSQVFAILGEYGFKLEIYSIDEAFIDLTGLVKDFDIASELAKKIKKRIKLEVGEWLKCSVGLASTRWLAKFASKEQKPDGLTVIKLKDLDEILAYRPLQHAWGIAIALENRLKLLGINNLFDLKHSQPQKLRQALGIQGYYLWAAVNGIEVGGLQSHGSHKSKSIGHSYCIPKQTTELNYLRSIMLKLCVKTGSRLRRQKLQAGGIMVGFNFVNGGGIWRSWKLPKPIFDSIDIFNTAKKILTTEMVTKKIRLLAISVSRLSPVSRQLSFFEDEVKKRQLVEALDEINNKFGEHTIIPGLLLPLKNQALDRIGFRKSVRPEEVISREVYVSEE